MFCSQCGAHIEQGAAFCSQCGSRVQSAQVPTVPITPSSAESPAPSTPGVAPDPTQSAPQPASPTPQPAQPTPQPAQPTPAASPANPIPALAKDPRVQAFLAPPSLRTAGATLGIGLASALIITLLSTALIATTSLTDLSNSLFSQASSAMSMFGGSVSKPGFLHLLVFMLVAGSAGEFSLHASTAGLTLQSSGMGMSMVMPLGLSGVALALGCAFGAYRYARKATIRFQWTGCAGAIAVGLASSIVYLVLAALFPISSSASAMAVTANIRLSGATVHTFFTVFLLSALGAAAGYALSDYAPASASQTSQTSNVFTAAWHWAHRARGFVRTYIESCVIYALVFSVCGLLLLIIASVRGHQSQLLLFIGLELPMVPFLVRALASFGGIALISGSETRMFSVFNAKDWLANSWWLLIVLIVVFLVTTLYIALRLTARNLYDPTYAQWKHAWKYPAATAVTWLLITLLFANIGMTMSAAGYGSQAASVGIAVWFAIVAALWAFAVEAIALTFGLRLLQMMPQTWRWFAGGVVLVSPATTDASTAATEDDRHAQTVSETDASDQNGSINGQFSATLFSTSVPESQGAAPSVTASTASASAMPAMPAPAVIVHKPMSTQTKLRLIIAAIVVGLFIVLFAAYSVISSTVFTPQAAANEYLSAIANGHFDQANDLSNPQVDTKQRALMTDKAATGENVTISNQRVSTTTTNSDGSVTATIVYTLDGKEVTDKLTVAAQGSRYVIFKNWKVTTPLVKQISVDITKIGGRVSVNGIIVDTNNAIDIASGTAVFKVYPGSYSITAPKSKFIESNTVKVSASSNARDSYVSLDVTPTAVLTDAIQSKIDTTLEPCVASTSNKPEGCPFEYSFWGDADDYRNVAWTLTKQPKVDTEDVDLMSNSFRLSTYGEVQITYQYKGWGDEWNDSKSSDYFYLNGTFVIDGDNVTVTLDDSNW